MLYVPARSYIMHVQLVYAESLSIVHKDPGDSLLLLCRFI